MGRIVRHRISRAAATRVAPGMYVAARKARWGGLWPDVSSTAFRPRGIGNEEEVDDGEEDPDDDGTYDRDDDRENEYDNDDDRRGSIVRET